MRRSAILALLLAAATAALIIARSGDDHGTRLVRSEFTNANGLRPGSVVRVGGAAVGSVRSLRVTARNTALVELELDDQAGSLGAGAAAAIRTANLLGEKFVDLTIGDRARPLASNRIPLAGTSTPVELDDVIDVLDPTTRGRLGLLLSEAGIALGDRGQDLRAALRLAPGSVDDARRLLGEVSSDTRVLERLLVESNRVSGAVARERRGLGALVETGASALQVPARRRVQLGGTLRAAPGTLAQLRATLQRLDRAGSALRPAARGLRATATPLEQTLRALPGFEAAARPALATITQVAPSLEQLGRQAAPTVRRLRPTATSLRDLAIDADALTGTLNGSAADVLGVMENWARANQTRDGIGHMFRISLSLAPDALRRLRAYLDASPGRQAHRFPLLRRVPAPAPRAADPARRTLDPVTRPLQRPVGRILDAARDATELPARNGSSQQLKPLLDYLLR